MHPILVDFGKIKIYSYGLMMVIGFFSALFMMNKFARKAEMTKQQASDLIIYVFLSGILGARVIYLLLHIEDVLADRIHIFAFQEGGLSWHGGILGAIICVLIYTKINKIKIWAAMDAVFMSSTLGLVFGRIGCFLNGCCYGKPTDLPWAVSFPYHQNPIPVHPTQLYEMILDLALFFFLIYWWDKRKFRGEVALMFMSLYSVIRFIVEFYRFNITDQMHMGLSTAQWASVIFFVISTAMILYFRKKSPGPVKERLEPPPEEEEK